MIRLSLLCTLLLLARENWGIFHIGMTKRGAAARTSFWSRGR